MLSKTALESSGSHIFLLDALTYVFVYYDAEVDPSTPFPPPKDSKYHKVILPVWNH
jgi:hypothetical protein